MNVFCFDPGGVGNSFGTVRSFVDPAGQRRYITRGNWGHPVLPDSWVAQVEEF